jgi:hypothetical protein
MGRLQPVGLSWDRLLPGQSLQSSRHAPLAVRSQDVAEIPGGRHIGMCLLPWWTAHRNVPTTLVDGTWNVPTTFTFVGP